MIYPFTRMVIYGIIWYQGESNSGRFTNQYACAFERLIYYWRQTWNQRTNGLTNPEFPFGFVQVILYLIICIFLIYLTFSYLQVEILQTIHSMDIHGFDGIRHLMLAMRLMT